DSRTITNLLIVWMLPGFWHGAAWNFVAWGLYYGIILILEKFVWGQYVEKWPGAVRHIYAMVLILIGWVLFFSPSLGYAL
ncbi:MBOAT family protein, partial [Erysipelatoclostridium ramosum]|nr:MBOAT family protein [Thomasclavelia ramosa]